MGMVFKNDGHIMTPADFHKKKKFNYSSVEKKAYWTGVGIATQRFKEDASILENSNPKIAKSARAGYDAVNFKDLNGKVFGK